MYIYLQYKLPLLIRNTAKRSLTSAPDLLHACSFLVTRSRYTVILSIVACTAHTMQVSIQAESHLHSRAHKFYDIVQKLLLLLPYMSLGNLINDGKIYSCIREYLIRLQIEFSYRICRVAWACL